MPAGGDVGQAQRRRAEARARRGLSRCRASIRRPWAAIWAGSSDWRPVHTSARVERVVACRDAQPLAPSPSHAPPPAGRREQLAAERLEDRAGHDAVGIRTATETHANGSPWA